MRSVTLTSGNREVERLANQRLERLTCDLVPENVRTDRGANLDDVRAAKAVDGARRQRIETLGHVEAAVGRCPGEERVNERNRRRSASCADPLHNWLVEAGSGLGRTGVGLPCSSTATSTTSASVTFTRSPCPVVPAVRGGFPHRSASTSTRTVTDVRPIRTVSGVEVHDISDVHRFVELDFPHRLCNEPVSRDLSCLDGRRQVDVGQDHSAEDGAVGVGVLRQQQDPDSRNALGHATVYCLLSSVSGLQSPVLCPVSRIASHLRTLAPSHLAPCRAISSSVKKRARH